MDYDAYMKPPPPAQHDFQDPAVMAAIHEEAIRQLDIFYGWGLHGATVERRRLREYKEQVYVGQIAYACMCGVARVTDGRVQYWHPGEACWVLYDATYNAYMVGFMRDFKTRYQRLMQAHAASN